MSIKIYTKTGDKGTTSLIGGTKVPKSDLRIDAYGNVDELNSYIGLAIELINDQSSRESLREIQDRLFTIGSLLACDPEKEIRMKLPGLYASDITRLEHMIDAMNEELPEMKSFILPGGSKSVATLHIARCVCRRTERAVVLLASSQQLPEHVLVYLNRLSDYLFVLARYIAKIENVGEIPWRPRVQS